MNIVIEYRLVTDFLLHKNVQLYVQYDGYVPAPADIVSIKGNPFIVYRLTYSPQTDRVFIAIEVFKAGNYTVEIEGEKF
jgi:hypothetical protein